MKSIFKLDGRSNWRTVYNSSVKRNLLLLLFLICFTSIGQSSSPTVTTCYEESNLKSINSNLVAPAPPIILDVNRALCDGESSLIEVVTTALTFYEETFDTNDEGVEGDPDCANVDPPTTCTGYTAPSNGQWTISGSSFDLTGNKDYLIVDKNKLEGRDIDGTLCFESNLIDISAVTGADFSLDINDDKDRMEASDMVAVNYSLDGGAFTNAATFTGDISGTQTVTEIGLVGNSILIQVCFTNNEDDEKYRLDNVEVSSPAPPAATYNFYVIDPVANPDAVPVASGNSYDPMTMVDMIDTIWVTCFDGVDESIPTMVIVNYDCVADLSIQKTVNNSSPMTGGIVTYTIEVTNNGPNGATGVAVTDALPTGLNYVLSSIAGPGTLEDTDPSGAGLMWSAISIPINGSVSLTFDATVASSSMITNIAEVTQSDQRDPNSTPNNNTPLENDQDNVGITPVCTVSNVLIQITQN